MFADVLCIFANDFKGFEEVVERLKAWTILGKPSAQMEYIKPSVIIVKQGTGSCPSATYDLLERLDVELSLLQREFIEFFSSIIVLHLADEQISSFSRHRRLKELIRRQITGQRQLRQTRGCLYNALHLSHSFSEAVAHTACTIEQDFNFLLSVRKEFVNSTAFLTNFQLLCARHCTTFEAMEIYIASALLLDAYPPGMHGKFFAVRLATLKVSAEFDPSLLYQSVYKQSCVGALQNLGSGRISSEAQSETILDHFTDLFAEMHNRNEKASEIHRDNMARLGLPWSRLYSNTTCLHCLCRKPEKVLTCGHSICDRCIDTFADLVEFSEYQYCLHECLLCSRGNLDTVLHPPTAGYRVLSIDGGGIRGVVPLEFLRHLQQYIGPSCRVQDLFDLAIGTSSGQIIRHKLSEEESNECQEG
ncbi:hypothetical protein ACLMJK_001361 [Lecanora helva]